MPDVLFTEPWSVYTMDHNDEMFDKNGDPIDDDYEFDVWAVGYKVEFGGDPYHAATAIEVADRMTYSVACYIRDLHNAVR